jgi:hypothetical protein
MILDDLEISNLLNGFSIGDLELGIGHCTPSTRCLGHRGCMLIQCPLALCFLLFRLLLSQILALHLHSRNRIFF